jgi:hypothetical protein
MRVTVDGEEVKVGDRPLTVIVHQQDMDIQAPDAVLIGPEQTVKTSNELEQDQWEFIRVNDNFLKAWKALWQDREPPQVLATSPLGTRHSVGLMLLMFMARGEDKQIHLQYPETYLHPAQCTRLMTMIYTIYPEHKK